MSQGDKKRGRVSSGCKKQELNEHVTMLFKDKKIKHTKKSNFKLKHKNNQDRYFNLFLSTKNCNCEKMIILHISLVYNKKKS